MLDCWSRCAYLSARVAEYFTYAVELCSPNATYKAFDKQRLFANLTRLLQVCFSFLLAFLALEVPQFVFF